MTRPWWRDAVVYQIYPRSFLDTSGDGVGDLDGVIDRLDHLAWLGVDALWLSPIYPSPMADFGYDVADHCAIDPRFGDLATFDRLIAEAHARGLRILLDWVPNHTSDAHPWFVASRSSRTDPRRDWYVWRDPAPGGGPPNNWVAAFGGGRPAWTYDDATGQYYLHLFLPQQPDLNWANPEVEAALHDVLRFWLDRGVDGFRADVVHLIGKDPALPDDPAELTGRFRAHFHDDEETHRLLRNIRLVLDEYPGDRVMVGEINLEDSAAIARYHGADDELHLTFDFGLLHAPWDAPAWHRRISEIEAARRTSGAWPTWVLANHDEPRTVTRLGSPSRARVAALLLLCLRGTPFLYAGEELGLPDAHVAPDRCVDPGGRDGCRAPIPWEERTGHGWAGDPWLPWPPEAAAHSAAAQRRRPQSMLHLYRRLLRARSGSAALRAGDLMLHEPQEGVLGFERRASAERRLVLANYADTPVAAPVPGDWIVEIATDDPVAGAPYPGTLEALQGLLLRPA